MPDFTLNPSCTVIVGMTGSGKTTFEIVYLLNSTFAAAFIFDDLNRIAPRIRVRPCYTAGELEAALASRWIVFNPSRMFPGDTKAAFRFFCRWAFLASQRGRGKKFFVAPEVWRHCTADSIPVELAMMSQAGREKHIELVVDTQQPEKLNDSIWNACTELVCFRLQTGTDALRDMGRRGVDRSVIERLAPGEFVAFNRLAAPDAPGAQLSGRVF
jgi:hypothetical protein